MYKLDFDMHFNLITWNVIFWGIKNDIITPDCAVHYAHKLIEKNICDNDDTLVEILILENPQKNEILKLIKRMYSYDSSKKDISINILRYIILDGLRQSEKNNKIVLENIENIYVDFDYPEDMKSFISYMPVEDDTYEPSNHTEEENEQRLIDKFNVFLTDELNRIVNHTL